VDDWSRCVKKWYEIKRKTEERGNGRQSPYILRMRGSVEAEKQSEGEWANESEGGLPKAETAEIGGSLAIRLFSRILYTYWLKAMRIRS